MARELISCFGPRIDDGEKIMEQNVANNWVMDTSTDVDAISPDDGSYFIKTVSGNIGSHSATGTKDITPYNHSYITIRNLIVEAYSGNVLTTETALMSWFTTVDNGVNRLLLRYKRNSASSHRLLLNSNVDGLLITSNTVFPEDEDHGGVMIYMDGTTIELFVNGQSEGSTLYAGKVNNTAYYLHRANVVVGAEHYFSNGSIWGSSSKELPDPDTCKITRLDPTGDGDTMEFGGDDGVASIDCADTALGDWSHWPLDGSDHVTTTSNCSGNGFDEIESAACGTVTLTLDSVGVAVIGVVSALIGSKTVAANLRISDGSSAIEQAIDNIVWTGALRMGRYFATAPDAGAWTQADIDALEIGVHSEAPGGDAESDVWPALWALVCEIDDFGAPPPPSATATRRSGVAFGSANAMAF